jgi:hypothetical protein
VAVGALPDGTPVIITGDNNAVRVWRLADGTLTGDPLTGHNGPVNARSLPRRRQTAPRS